MTKTESTLIRLGEFKMEREDQNTKVSNSQELFVIVKCAINFVKKYLI